MNPETSEHLPKGARPIKFPGKQVKREKRVYSEETLKEFAAAMERIREMERAAQRHAHTIILGGG